MRLQNDGSVWQSKHHNCKYFAFYMIKYDKLYVWKTDILLTWLENNISNYPQKIVKNPTKTSMGYAIPINIVEKICDKITDLTIYPTYLELKTELQLK